MGAAKKSLMLFAVLLSLYAIWPMQLTYGASVTYFDADHEIDNRGSYLIAGKEYQFSYYSDRALSTSASALYQYSTDNGASWNYLSTTSCGYEVHCFTLPIDPYLTSALFRVTVSFVPLVGGNSVSQKTIGPYRILQPPEPSDYTATPNDDGTVTLNWNDNSNMESYYRITRSGPDGDKTFDVGDTMDYTGPLKYVDKNTNKSKGTYYLYKIFTVIDKYQLPEDIEPGIPWAVVLTKVPISKLDIYKEIPVVPFDPNKSVLTYLDNINFYVGDLAKPVTDIKMDKKEIELKQGESMLLTAAVSPSDAANKKVVWGSSKGQYAEVDENGKVTAKSEGIAIITATTESGGRSDSCIVTVVSKDEPKTPDNPTANLTDIAGHKANVEIVKAVSLGIVSGYPNGTFLPDGKVTRAEFATMLVRGLKPADEGTPLTFKDKDKIGSWAVKAVKQAVKLGIISGYADGTFRPNANITHSEMISMVVRASGLPLAKTEQTGFADDADIPDWAKPAVSTAEETGIIIVGGLPGNKFAPKALATRAEAASAIVRMLDIRK